jgi:hypothetical protein
MPSVLQRAIEAPEIVKALRSYGVTQIDVASVAGVTDRAVRGWTTSEIRPQRYDRLADLRDLEPVKAFETRAQDFFCASLSMVGLLIHAAVGSLGGLGFRLPNRQGLTA